MAVLLSDHLHSDQMSEVSSSSSAGSHSDAPPPTHTVCSLQTKRKQSSKVTGFSSFKWYQTVSQQFNANSLFSEQERIFVISKMTGITQDIVVHSRDPLSHCNVWMDVH